MMEQVIQYSPHFPIYEIPDHTDIRRQQKYGKPPPRIGKRGKDKQAEQKHGKFFKLNQGLHGK
jgi:hypothetical protein